MISFVLLADTIRIENGKNRRKKNGKLIENVEEQTRECGGGERETERERGNGRFWIRHEPKSFNIAQCKWVAQRRSQRQLDGDGDAHLPSSGSSDQSHEWDAAEQLAYMAIRCRADLLDAKWHAVFGFPSLFLRKMVSFRLQKVRIRPLLIRRTYDTNSNSIDVHHKCAQYA